MGQPATEADGSLALWVCNRCGWVYAPAEGDPTRRIPPLTAFEDLAPDWTCPSCGADRDYFFH
jgi:rubredoxin